MAERRTWYSRSLRPWPAMLLLCGAAHPLLAQSAPPGQKPLDAVRLLVRPRVGDTLWLQLEQTIETRGAPVANDTKAPIVGSSAASGIKPPSTAGSPDYGPRRSRGAPQVISMHMFAHSLVEASDLGSTTLLAMTDSLNVQSGAPGKLPPPRAMPLPADGRQVRIRVTPDGAMAVLDPSPGAIALEVGLSGMPAMLPALPVQVGEYWNRDIPLPSLPQTGFRADGVVRARFHLDSLSRDRRTAYVSMEGTLHRDGAARDLRPGTRLVTAGTLHGTLTLDRVRGWIIDARTTIDVTSDVTPAPGDPAPAMSLSIRLTQSMRVR